MKKSFAAAALALLFALVGCGQTGEQPAGKEEFQNPGDSLGGGGYADYTPSATVSESMEKAESAAPTPEKGASVPENATILSEAGKIDESGNYVVRGSLAGTVSVKAENVHLFLDGASVLAEEGKAITSDYPLVLTLSGENAVETTAASTNAVSCDGALTVNGGGTLLVRSTKNAVKANSICIAEATLDIEATGDGLHAEIDAYDDLTSAPAFSYADGGWVLLDGANVTIRSGDDGVQADTFVLMRGGKLDVTTNGGAPQTITEASSDSGDGKGVKAGAIDWGADGAEILSDEYFIGIQSGEVTVNSNDDALHSDGKMEIAGGTLAVAAGDDGLHAEALLTVTGGSIAVSRCYEGLEAAKVEISGGQISVTSADDGINAADGTTAIPGNANNNCHIVISGGDIYVNAEGDGIDSNGSMLISGGTVRVDGPTNAMNAALDADGNILVNGGYLFACGPIGMVQTPANNSAQNTVSFAYSGNIAAGTVLSLAGADGNAIFSHEVKKSCRSVIVSCPELVKNGSFSILGGDTVLCTFTVSGAITTVGSAGGMGRPGSMPPGGFGPGGGGRH